MCYLFTERKRLKRGCGIACFSDGRGMVDGRGESLAEVDVNVA